MTLHEIETYTDHSRVSEFYGSDPKRVPKGHPYARKLFRPESISIQWPEGGQPERASVAGTILRKDGTSRGHAVVITYKLTEAPDWVKELAQELHAHQPVAVAAT